MYFSGYNGNLKYFDVTDFGNAGEKRLYFLVIRY